MADEWSRRGRLAHPDSPAGGSGTGFSRAPAPPRYPPSIAPNPDSPAARAWDWESELPRIYLEAEITVALQGIESASSLEELTRLVNFLPGPQSFESGISFGIAQEAGSMAGAFREVVRMFAEAGLHDAARLPSAGGPLLGARIEEQAARWIFGDAALKRARDRRDNIVRELGLAITRPGALLGTARVGVPQQTINEWRLYQQAIERSGLLSRFEAGKILGALLARLLLLILDVRDVTVTAAIAAENGELARLATELQAVGAASGNIVGDAPEAASRMPRTPKRSKQFQTRPRTPFEAAEDAISSAAKSAASPIPQLATTPPTLPSIPPSLSPASLQKQLQNAGETFLKDKVGLTPQALLALARQETGVDFVSAFKDAETAEKAILATIAANKAKIEAWLAQAKKEILVVQHTLDQIVGLWAKRDSPQAMATSAMQLAMQAESESQDAYKILSAFPVPEG